ncbi:hypothetical protein D3C81_2248440 [compost metagenome]
MAPFSGLAESQVTVCSLGAFEAPALSELLLSAELPQPASAAPAKEKTASPVNTFDIFFVILNPSNIFIL